MHPSDGTVNALDLLAYLSEVQLSIRVARQLGYGSTTCCLDNGN